MWSISGSEHPTRLLSFNDLAQSYFIDFIRKNVGISAGKAREILKNAKLETNSPYPLLDRNVKVFFKHILMDIPARRRRPRQLVDLSQHRQLAMEEVVDLFATRIRRNKSGEIVQLFPWKHWKRDDDRTPVTIDPNVMSGRLVITGTRIPVHVVAMRKRSGEEVRDLARDYGIPQVIIKQALRHIGLRKAA
jgi:uncharacterized protein (DUF433 family)